MNSVVNVRIWACVDFSGILYSEFQFFNWISVNAVKWQGVNWDLKVT